MTRECLIQALNKDLAMELGKIARYGYQAAQDNLIDAELWQVFECEVEDELRHVQALIEAIMALGGQPTTTPVELDEPVDPRAMLAADLVLAEAELENYQTHARLACSSGETALKSKLEAIAADEAEHIQVLRQQLARLESSLAIDLPETNR